LQCICICLGETLVVRPILIGLGVVRQRLVQAELQGKDAGAAEVILRSAIDIRFVGLEQAVEDCARIIELALVQQVLRRLNQRRVLALGRELLLSVFELRVEFVVVAGHVYQL
jgi:hypothetical protein